ncbi:MAG TPA: DEAD/DEAH box helicase [Caldilineaceae bacterium]|nr:DEAD/DEAH box helicase [Caldilineaceae bacterium]
MKTAFSNLNLRPELVQAVAALGYEEPTPIQEMVIPVLLGGQDVIGQAQTGTGKTAAFALPILNALSPEVEGVQSLILAPTRELAQQVAQAITDYARNLEVTVLAVYGGQAYERQIRMLRRGVDIVVGTPGRLIDLMKRNVLDLSQVRTLVLDEADEMLSMGFIEDIETILQATPTERQTALFSATLPPEIRRLAGKYMRDPQSLTIQRKELTVSAIEQRYYLVNERDKTAALTRLFEVEEIVSALIFVRTRMSAGELANELTVRGFASEAIHGDLSQDAREQVLNRFRQNQIKVLVATDVAARGLDIDDISHVFNFDLPLDTETYVHRVGRTGRAGRSGVALSLVTPGEEWRMKRIEKYIKQEVTLAPLPSVEEILAKREAQLLEQMAIWLRRGRYRRESELVAELIEAGHDPWQVAAAALKVARAEEKQRPIAEISEVKPVRERGGRQNGRGRERQYEGRGGRRSDQGAAHRGPQGERSNRPARNRPVSRQSHEEGMVRLMLNAGKNHGIRPNDVVGTIAFHADIPGKTIGAIRIQPEQTFVDIPEQFVQQVLTNGNHFRIREREITVVRA